MIVRVSVVLKRAVVGDVDYMFQQPEQKSLSESGDNVLLLSHKRNVKDNVH